MATTRNEREALGVDYAEYREAGERADLALKRHLRGRYFKRPPKGHENRHARRAKAARLRRLRKRHPLESDQQMAEAAEE